MTSDDSILRESPRDTEALVGLGTVLAWASELDSAETVYRRVLELKPHASGAHYGLAFLLLQQWWHNVTHEVPGVTP